MIAVDNRETALECAVSCGADVAVAADKEAGDRIWSATRGHGADIVIDYVGDDETLMLTASIVSAGGDITIVGTGEGALPVSFATLPPEVRVQTSRWGSEVELTEVLALAANSQIQPITTTYRLAHAVQAYADLRAGQVTGRAVVLP